MKTAKDVLKSIKDNDVKYVDLRFTDPRGKWQHVTFDVAHDRRGHLRRRHDVRRLVDRRLEGDQRIRHVPDARSRSPRRSIRSSPRPPWSSSATCSSRPPASPTTATRAASPRRPRPMVKSTGVGDTVFFGPEAEFFVFDDVRFKADPYNTGFKLDSSELPTNSRHRIRGRQPRPPHPHQGRLLPGPAAWTRRRTCAPKCSAPWPRWASRSRSITTKWRPPSTSSA